MAKVGQNFDDEIDLIEVIQTFQKNKTKYILLGLLGFLLGILNRYAKFKHDREVKKREKEFYKNATYEKESEIVNSVDYEEYSDKFNDIDVHENNNDVKK